MPLARVVEAERGPRRVLGFDEIEIREERRRLVPDELAPPDATNDGACPHGMSLDSNDLPVLVADDDPRSRSD